MYLPVRSLTKRRHRPEPQSRPKLRTQPRRLSPGRPRSRPERPSQQKLRRRPAHPKRRRRHLPKHPNRQERRRLPGLRNAPALQLRHADRRRPALQRRRELRPPRTSTATAITTASATSTSSAAPTPTATATPTRTATSTRTSTATATSTASATSTNTAAPTPTAAATAAASCSGGQRELDITNNSSRPIWVGASGGIIRSLCVVNNGASDCLATSVSSDGSCSCGSVRGTLECPRTASATGPESSELFCACSQDSDCGSGAGCSSNHLCFYSLPTPTSFAGFSPASPWNWELPAAGDTASFCFSQPSVTFDGKSTSGQVWWSGNVFARTGCQPDGTGCLTGDCTNDPNSPCPAGVGGSQPASLAEFTWQSTATDYYDVSIINGANLGMQFGPIAGPTQTSGNVPSGYWCTTPGQGCSYDFGQFTKSVPLPSVSHPTDYTATLMLTREPCTAGTGNPHAGQPPAGCPAFVDPQGVAYSCSGAAAAHNGTCFKTCSSDSQCPGGLDCLTAGDGKSYCQCSSQSDCAAGQFCGTQLVPGLGDSSGYLLVSALSTAVRQPGRMVDRGHLVRKRKYHRRFASPRNAGAQLPRRNYRWRRQHDQYREPA